MMTFIEALRNGDLDAIRSFPKSDLHNHFVLLSISETALTVQKAESC